MTRRLFPLILCLVFAIGLSACGPKTVTTTASTTTPSATTTSTVLETLYTPTTTTTLAPLGIPSGIVLEDGVLTWDPVDGATGYVLELDGTEYASETPSYDLSAFPDGTHVARVRAQSGVRQSEYSESATFLLVLRPGVPYGLEEADGRLVWNAVENATGYRVLFGETSAEVTDPAYDLSALPENGLYVFTVSALFAEEAVSDPSLPFVYDTCETQLDEIGIRFVKGSPQDLSLDFSAETWILLGIVTPEGNLLDSSAYSEDEKILTLLQDYLLTVEYGTRTYRILTDQGFLAMDVEIADDRQPYMISSGQITFTGEDIVLEFEVYDGTVDSLSGNGITEADYLIQGATVRISASYVLSKFTENPDRVTLILGYTLSANEYVSIGYVFIRLP